MGFEGESIVSAVCVNGYCCQSSGDCNYIDDVDTEGVLCAKYRDSDSMLCSECDEGLSESVNSWQCMDCKGETHWEFLALPAGIAVVMSLFIILTNTDKEEDSEHDKKEDQKNGGFWDNIRHEDNKHMVASLAKVTVYYEQG